MAVPGTFIESALLHWDITQAQEFLRWYRDLPEQRLAA